MNDPSRFEKSRNFSILYSRGHIGAYFNYRIMGLLPLCLHELHTGNWQCNLGVILRTINDVCIKT